MSRLLFLILFWAASFAAILSAQPGKVYKSLKDVRNPQDVYILKLNFKRLHAIPDEVFTFTNLCELDLSRNFIDSVPPAIANLRNLQKLSLARNWIHSLPDEISQLSHLRVLDLNRNPIRHIPASVAALSRLEKLILWQTGIVEVPPSLVALDGSLKVLDLRACPLSRQDQQQISDLLPSVQLLWDQDCNCK